ncbi:caffeic acid 3-O-methyltransferase-like [Carya illinoinensis]|uniref:caffeic acid 3-O-methyltransferase-like n=1 Tax=Carya illinoinensis TaxID=32201 RepID=UPI001C728AAD|nr:caffeic acid 3-O-methyltransferase-like [Carya illinoinensis]
MASLAAFHLSNLDGDQIEEDESFVYAGQLANSLVLPMALQTAIELGVFEILAKAGPGAKLSPSQISTEMPATNPEAPEMLDRILRMLASHSVLNCYVGVDDAGSFQRLYALSPVSKHFVTVQDGGLVPPYDGLASRQSLLILFR